MVQDLFYQKNVGHITCISAVDQPRKQKQKKKKKKKKTIIVDYNQMHWVMHTKQHWINDLFFKINCMLINVMPSTLLTQYADYILLPPPGDQLFHLSLWQWEDRNDKSTHGSQQNQMNMEI